MAGELTTWMQMLARHGPARPGNPSGYGCACSPPPGASSAAAAAGRIVRGGRRPRLRLAATWPWATQITAAITRLQAFAPS